VTEQAVDRRFVSKIEGEIRILDIPGNQTAALHRKADSVAVCASHTPGIRQSEMRSLAESPKDHGV
jgi:hypothetical protein